MTCRARCSPARVEVEVRCPPDELVAGLSDPRAYPHPVAGKVEVFRTHISTVFLAGDHAWKLKRPLSLPFLDAARLERRRELCQAEVELNARLAPGVYLGVVPLVREGGGLRLGGRGPAVEWAVHMRRLPADRSLAALLEAGRLDAALVARVGERIARFHATARRGPDVARWATFPAVAALLRGNLIELGSLSPGHLAPPLLAGLSRRLEEELVRQRLRIEGRARRGFPVDGHGDLRLEHVYSLDGELSIIDCVEFSDRLRCGDPVLDLAFLTMELERAGRDDLARALEQAYFAVSGDAEGRLLLPLYVAHRALVRAKVEALTGGERKLSCALAHALQALARLSPPRARPCLVLLAGLPGSGKSVLARRLVEQAGFTWIRSDLIRKELAGLSATTSARGAQDEGLYSAAWSDRTYATCLERAEAVWSRGGRALVDANFPSEARRQAFLRAARAAGVPARLLLLEVPPEVARARIAARKGDPSDADTSTYDQLRARFEAPGPETARWLARIDASGTVDQTARAAEEALRGAELA